MVEQPECGDFPYVAVTRRLDEYQRRHPWAGFPIALAYKYYDDFGPYLAAVLTYYGIVAIFPLLLVGSTVLSFVPRPCTSSRSSGWSWPTRGGSAAARWA